LRIVIDTNVFISSLLGTKGKSRRIIDLWRFETVTLCISKQILTEYFAVLGRFGLAREPEGQELLHLFQTRYHLVYVGTPPNISVSPKDQAYNRLLDCAVAAEASYIVSSDRHLLNFKSYKGITTLMPSHFLKLML
jgi:putative PIN family toxin of toxin-antitoxin system